MKLKLSEIVIDPAVAIREGTDEDTIQRYEDNLEQLPPIVVFETDHKYLLADGFHRWAAATRKGWSEIEAEVREGTYAEASEYAITANLKHGKPLTREEYKNAVRRLQILHPDWKNALGQWEITRFTQVIQRGEKFVRLIIHSDEVRKATSADVALDDTTLEEVYRAPRVTWPKLVSTAQDQGLTYRQTAEKVRQIKTEPHRIDEILTPIPEKLYKEPELEVTPADQIMPLTNEISKLCDMLEPNLYDWEKGKFLKSHVLAGLYILADKTTKIIKFLEGRE